MLRFINLGLLFLFVNSIAQAEEVTFGSILDSIEGAVPERTTEGRIQSIDLVGRSAVIGGFMYYFGPSTDAYPS